MVFTLCMPVMAAGMSHFKPVNTYSNNFADVPSAHWAMPSIKTCYEYALMYGSSNTKFNPGGELTIAEALVMADRVHSIYNTGETAVFSGTPWYAPYEAYAKTNGIIAESDFADVTKKATRAQMAYIFFNSIPEWEFTEINSISRIPDVSVSNKYFHEIKGLYNAGILTGSDSKGSFYPDNNITRAEAAAIISRVVDVSLRKTFELSEDVLPEETVLTAQQISEKCAPSVAYVEVYDKSGKPFASGSGFFIDSNGTFVTNYHVIDGAYSAKIMSTEGKVYNVEGVYDFDIGRDTALLKVTGHDFEYLEIDTSTPVAGQRVYAIGSPKGLDNTISDGLVSNPNREIDGLDFIQISVPISSGSSGGALINEHGKVIGITSAGIGSNGNDLVQNLNLAIPIHYINDLERTQVKSLTRLSSLVGKSYDLALSATSVNLSAGTSTTVTVTYTPGTDEILTVGTMSSSIAEVEWGNNISTGKCEIIITGVSAGSTEVYVYYDDPSINKRVSVPVTVMGSSSSGSSSSGGSYSGNNYYRNGAPSYQYVTGMPCIYSYYGDTERTVYYYAADANLFAHYLNSTKEPIAYMEYLENSGWIYYDGNQKGNVYTYYFTKNYELMSVVVDLDLYEVWIIMA